MYLTLGKFLVIKKHLNLEKYETSNFVPYRVMAITLISVCNYHKLNKIYEETGIGQQIAQGHDLWEMGGLLISPQLSVGIWQTTETENSGLTR